MKRTITRTSPNNMRGLTAYLPMLAMFLTPLASIAAASPNNRPANSAENGGNGGSLEEKPAVNQPAPAAEPDSAVPQPEPAPQPLPEPLVGGVTATMTAAERSHALPAYVRP